MSYKLHSNPNFLVCQMVSACIKGDLVPQDSPGRTFPSLRCIILPNLVALRQIAWADSFIIVNVVRSNCWCMPSSLQMNGSMWQLLCPHINTNELKTYLEFQEKLSTLFQKQWTRMAADQMAWWVLHEHFSKKNFLCSIEYQFLKRKEATSNAYLDMVQ